MSDPTTKQATTLLVNDDDRAIAGYVVKWIFVAEGTTHSFFQTFSDEDQIDNPTGPIVGYGLKSHERRLMAPSFNVHTSDTADPRILERVNAGRSRRMTTSATQVASNPMSSLDAVIFSDSTISGPDESEYLQRFMAERNAQHDAKVSVLLAQSKGESPEEISQRLRNTVADGQMASGSTAPDHYYREARGRWAQAMLQVQQYTGRMVSLATPQKRHA